MQREEIEALLIELSDELSIAEIRGEMLIVGGAAMALAYSTRRSTSDLDAIFDCFDQLADPRHEVRSWRTRTETGELLGFFDRAAVDGCWCVTDNASFLRLRHGGVDSHRQCSGDGTRLELSYTGHGAFL